MSDLATKKEAQMAGIPKELMGMLGMHERGCGNKTDARACFDGSKFGTCVCDKDK